MIQVLSLNLRHGPPGAGVGGGSTFTGSLASADISDPATARAVMWAAAEQIVELASDIIAPQEVDLSQARFGCLHRAVFLVEELGMPTCRFSASYAGPMAGLRRRSLCTALSSSTDDVLGLLHTVVGAGPTGYGNALLLRFPVSGWYVKRPRCGIFSMEKCGERAWDPYSHHVSTASQCVMVAAVLEVPEGAGGPIWQLSVASTHLATRESTAVRQLATVWGAFAGLPGPHLLVGDYNLSAEQVDVLGLGRTVGEGSTFPAVDPKRHINRVLIDLWSTGPDGLPLTDEAAAAGRDPPLRVVEWDMTSSIISDCVGIWVDLEPVG